MKCLICCFATLLAFSSCFRDPFVERNEKELENIKHEVREIRSELKEIRQLRLNGCECKNDTVFVKNIK